MQNIELHIKGGGKQTVVIQTGMIAQIYDWLPIIKKLSQALYSRLYHRQVTEKWARKSATYNKASYKRATLSLLNKLAIQEPFI